MKSPWLQSTDSLLWKPWPLPPTNGDFPVNCQSIRWYIACISQYDFGFAAEAKKHDGYPLVMTNIAFENCTFI